MKKLLLLTAILIFACTTDSEGNPCIYEPTLTTQAATDITETSATLNGVISIVSENCDVPNNTEQGFVYSTEIQPTLEDIQVNVNGTNITTTIEGLEPNTTYYVRSFLTNDFGDFYGDEISFITVAGQIFFNYFFGTSITGNSFTVYAELGPNSSNTITSNGVCWSVNPNPTIEDSFINCSTANQVFLIDNEEYISFNCIVEGLNPITQYYTRAFATNEFDTYYSDEQIFNTICDLDFDGDGICDDDDNDDDNDGVEDSQDCAPLDPNINPGATEIFDGIDNNCNGEIDEGLFDCSGNPVPTIVYGTQEWTVGNTCQTTYRDGTTIGQAQNFQAWSGLSTGAWAYYDPQQNTLPPPTTGVRLYNWYAVMGIHNAASLSDASQRKEFAPEGWHVPSIEEWETLRNYLITNGYNYDGTTTENKIAKSMASTTGWISNTEPGAPGNDQSLNNSSGFNAFPLGYRDDGGGTTFRGQGYSTYFWSSSDNTAFLIGYYVGTTPSVGLRQDFLDNRYGVSVRFVKD